MQKKETTWKIVFGLVALGIAVFALSSDRATATSGCPRDINCPDIYDPVTCSNGITYPNACYAYRDCATGCGAW